MSNTDFDPFTPNPPGIFDVEPQGNGRKAPRKKAAGKRGRPKKVAAEQPAEPKRKAVEPKQPRKPRKPRQAKIDLELALSALAGLTEDDSRFVTGVVQAMGAFPIGQKRRIVGALSRLFY